MNHTAYDVRLLANQVNRAKYNDIFASLEKTAEEGAYQHILDSRKLKLKATDIANLTGLLINLGFNVSQDPQSNSIVVSWMDKEKLKN